MEYFGQDIIEDERESVNGKNNVHYFLQTSSVSSTISVRGRPYRQYRFGFQSANIGDLIEEPNEAVDQASRYARSPRIQDRRALIAAAVNIGSCFVSGLEMVLGARRCRAVGAPR